MPGADRRHVCIFESSQLESSYVGDLVHVCKFKIVLNIHVGTCIHFPPFLETMRLFKAGVQHRKETQREEIDGVIKTQQASLT